MFKQDYHFDPYPYPKDKAPLFFNDPLLADQTYLNMETRSKLEDLEGNVRIYIPLDLNKDAILRRLDDVIMRFGPASERNEFAFENAVDLLIYQMELYDRM